MSSVIEYWGEVRKQRHDLLHLPSEKIQTVQIHRRILTKTHGKDKKRGWIKE